MEMKTDKTCLTGLALLALSVCNPPAYGAGLWLYEMGTPDVGTATAGMASRAADAATAFANPAGMTRLKESQLMVGLQPIYADVKFDTESSTFGGGDGGNAGGLVPTGSVSFVESLSDELKFGLTAGSYLGLGLKYNSTWAGRYYVQEEDFVTSFLNGAVGYKVNDWLSVGGGVSLVYGQLSAQTNINNVQDDSGDGRLKFKDTDTAPGWNAGLLIEPRPGTRVGLTYTSKVDLKYKDTPSFNGTGPLLDNALKLSGLNNSKSSFDFTLPQQVMLSVYHDLTPDLAIMADLGWQNWSQFGKIGVAIDTTAATGTNISRNTSINANFQDTWHTALGARYRLNPLWSVSAGIAYDSSPVSNSDRSIVLPLDRQYRYGLGLQYDWRKNISFGAAYEYMDAGSAPVNQTGGAMKGDLKGRFKDDAFSIFALNMNWKF
jgi:long-chain fatty acid transport protein